MSVVTIFLKDGPRLVYRTIDRLVPANGVLNGYTMDGTLIMQAMMNEIDYVEISPPIREG